MLWVLLGVLVAYVTLVIVFNRIIPPSKHIRYEVVKSSQEAATQLGNELQIVSWNLGYAGLGQESNFVADGGTDLLPPSKEHVRRNVEGITKVIGEFDADMFLFQELAGASLVNRQTDLKSSVTRKLAHQQHVYSADFRTRLIPPPLKLDIGSAVFSNYPIASAEGQLLPLEGFHAGIVRKNYRLLVTRIDLDDGQQLVVVNVHLAAFDERGSVRYRQLDEVRSFAEEEFARGQYVIVGGDWNLRLVETDFPHQTKEEFLFWLADLPQDFFASGWTIAADDRAPTVRTVHKAYEEGDNYVCVIDGFVLSPNIHLLEVENVNLGFRHTDHHPVRMRVRLGSQGVEE